jgi:hypothetical protein
MKLSTKIESRVDGVFYTSILTIQQSKIPSFIPDIPRKQINVLNSTICESPNTDEIQCSFMNRFLEYSNMRIGSKKNLLKNFRQLPDYRLLQEDRYTAIPERHIE